MFYLIIFSVLPKLDFGAKESKEDQQRQVLPQQTKIKNPVENRKIQDKPKNENKHHRNSTVSSMF